MFVTNYGPASKYYDLFGSKDDIAFYKDLALKHGRRALELGVGTGRVAIELAKTGVTVWGLDSSRYMLNAARSKLKKESNAVRNRVVLKHGDMREFELTTRFPFCYLASATFEHCITREDQRQCLSSIFKALEDKGVLAFDVSNPTLGRPDASWWIQRAVTPSEEEVVRTVFSRRDPQTNIVSVDLFFDVYRRGRLNERYYEHGEARISSREEIENLLKDADYETSAIYGDFDKSSYGITSQRVIFVATRQ